MNTKNIALVVVLLIIGASTYYLEGTKAKYVPQEDVVSQDKVIIPMQDNQFAAEKALLYPKAPELAGITGYINTPEFSLEQIRGKVVLVDFWTYSCINCIRTQPYLNAWYDAYASDGLVIVGVHTPEFEFEKDYENVKQAVEKAGIKYPVVQDNNFGTWTAYQNRYWPRKYLVDVDGFIRYDHIGEGGYSETEAKIKELLGERKQRYGMQINLSKSAAIKTSDIDFGKVLTPEIYFGYNFDRGGMASEEGFKPEQVNHYSMPANIEANKAYLIGDWLNKGDYSELVGQTGSVLLVYAAKNVNIVGSADNATELKIFLDGNAVEGTENLVKAERLYNVVSADTYGAHVLEIESSRPGFRIYTFTFG